MPYRFIQDEDAHWYLIPSHKVSYFDNLVEHQEHDRIEREFGAYRTGHPSLTDVEPVDRE